MSVYTHYNVCWPGKPPCQDDEGDDVHNCDGHKQTWLHWHRHLQHSAVTPDTHIYHINLPYTQSFAKKTEKDRILFIQFYFIINYKNLYNLTKKLVNNHFAWNRNKLHGIEKSFKEVMIHILITNIKLFQFTDHPITSCTFKHIHLFDSWYNSKY